MKLPCTTEQHERAERSREFHEEIYAAYLAGEQMFVPNIREWKDVSGSLHRFWNSRGFSLHGKTKGDTIHVWIERSTRYESSDHIQQPSDHAGSPAAAIPAGHAE